MTITEPRIRWKLIEDGNAFTRVEMKPRPKKSWLRRLGAWLVKNS